MTIRILLAIFLSVIFSPLTFCQTNIIKGTIVSYETKEPLPFYSIVLKGKKDYGAITDNEGKFVLQNISRSKNDYLKVSFIGQKCLKIINIPNKDTINLDTLFIPTYAQGGCFSEVVIPKNTSKISAFSAFYYTKKYRIKQKKAVIKKNKNIAYNYRYSFENKKYRIFYKNNTINLRKPIKHE